MIAPVFLLSFLPGRPSSSRRTAPRVIQSRVSSSSCSSLSLWRNRKAKVFYCGFKYFMYNLLQNVFKANFDGASRVSSFLWPPHPPQLKSRSFSLWSWWRSPPLATDCLPGWLRNACRHTVLIAGPGQTDRRSLVLIIIYYSCRVTQRRMKQNSKMFLLLLGTCLNANINSFPYSAWPESIIDIISITVAGG